MAETIHNLTTEQLRKLTSAIGDGSNWPQMTDDPEVNYAVDCVIGGIIEEGGKKPPPYDKSRYTAEAEAFKTSL
jgi:hypothetical protein